MNDTISAEVNDIENWYWNKLGCVSLNNSIDKSLAQRAGVFVKQQCYSRGRKSGFREIGIWARGRLASWLLHLPASWPWQCTLFLLAFISMRIRWYIPCNIVAQSNQKILAVITYYNSSFPTCGTGRWPPGKVELGSPGGVSHICKRFQFISWKANRHWALWDTTQA